jgi:hypoxanthine-guanine phosphoribosyltransferase
VDDVMTTGNTLNEAAALLKRYGAARVTNLVLARTPSPSAAGRPPPPDIHAAAGHP